MGMVFLLAWLVCIPKWFFVLSRGIAFPFIVLQITLTVYQSTYS